MPSSAFHLSPIHPVQVKFFVLDATALALELGLGMRINTLMQSAFYRLSGVLPVEQVFLHLEKCSQPIIHAFISPTPPRQNTAGKVNESGPRNKFFFVPRGKKLPFNYTRIYQAHQRSGATAPTSKTACPASADSESGTCRAATCSAAGTQQQDLQEYHCDHHPQWNTPQHQTPLHQSQPRMHLQQVVHHAAVPHSPRQRRGGQRGQ